MPAREWGEKLRTSALLLLRATRADPARRGRRLAGLEFGFGN